MMICFYEYVLKPTNDNRFMDKIVIWSVKMLGARSKFSS
jgi:hypothetical protein